MQDGLELLPGGRVREDEPSQFAAAEETGLVQKLVSERPGDFGKGGLAGLDELSSEQIGINDRDTALRDKIAGGGFAHADSASPTERFHGSPRR
jgi:hypothetical protein